MMKDESTNFLLESVTPKPRNPDTDPIFSDPDPHKSVRTDPQSRNILILKKDHF
jgi:hypothetical protein